MKTWTEWNITPSGEHDEFLAKVIYPFLLDFHPDSWHFFWEWGENDDKDTEVCRIRFLAGEKLQSEFRNRIGEHTTILHGVYIEEYYEGAHGKRDETYEGEEAFYGKRVWDATHALWCAHSELALLLAVQAHEGKLERPRSMHWKRTAHLTANQLELPDVRMCLEQGHRYMTIIPQMTGRDVSPAESRVLAELDRYLYPADHI